MAIQKILSKNASFQKFEVLQTNRNKRHKHNEFLIEGVRNINEAVKNKWHIISFLYSGSIEHSPWATDMLLNVKTKTNFELTNDLMKELSKKEDTSELMAVVQMRSNEDSYFNFGEKPIIALFDRPSNKGNLGTLLRSCDAFGIDGLIITGHSVDIYEPDVISSSMGSFFKIPFLRLCDNVSIDSCIEGLKKSYPDLKIVGTTSHKKNPLHTVDLTTPVLFLIGNETDGLNRHLVEMCDVLTTIPMSTESSASSFNVSCAATVMFYEVLRQRGFAF